MRLFKITSCVILLIIVQCFVLPDYRYSQALQASQDTTFKRPYDEKKFNGYMVSSKFGTRTINRGGTISEEFHTGIDYRVPYGEEVEAMYDGEVTYAGWAGGYGWLIKIDHGVINGKHVETWYAHLSKQLVLEKDFISGVNTYVRKGQPIALAGDNGLSEGPHVHIEIREGVSGKRLVPVHPCYYIQPDVCVR
jgi:murein DD-endopeptidase MepM/ murein hydrolase activator NlpD